MRYPAEKRTTVPTNPAFPTINGNRRNRMIPHIVRTTGKNTPDIEPSFALDFTRSSMGCLMGACDSWMGETAVLTLSLRASLTKSVSKALPALFWKRDISKWVWWLELHPGCLREFDSESPHRTPFKLCIFGSTLFVISFKATRNESLLITTWNQ